MTDHVSPSTDSPQSTRGSGRLVWGLFAAMTACNLLLVDLYGVDMPIEDDWEGVVPLVVEQGPLDLSRAWIPMNEHRFPLAKATWMTLRSWGVYDFRASMWINAALLSIGCGLILLAVVRARGRLVWTDAAIPVVLLNWTHACNITFAMQLHFVLATFFACVALAIIVASRGRPGVGLTVAYVLAVAALPLTDAIGLVLSVPLACWLPAIALFGRVGWTRRALLVTATLGIWWLAFVAFVPHEGNHPPPAHPVLIAIYAIRLLAMSAGKGISAEYYVVPMLVGGLIPALALPLVARFRRSAQERVLASGLVIFGGAFVTLAAAVAYGRSGWGIDGAFAIRYTTMMVPLAVAAYLVGRLAVASKDAASLPPLHRGFAIFLLVLCPLNGWGGYKEMVKRSRRAIALREAIEAGTPLDELEATYIPPIHPHPERVVQRMLELRERGITPYDALIVDPSDDVATVPDNTVKQ